MAISVNGVEYPTQSAYLESVNGTDDEISSTKLTQRLKSDSHQWKDWYTVGSVKDPSGTKTISVKLSNDKATLFELACEVCDIRINDVVESSARNLILNTIHILRDFDHDRPDIDVDNLERAFNEAWKITPGSVLRKHLEEVA
jgi:hypothetical protein